MFAVTNPSTLNCSECSQWLYDRQGQKVRRKTEHDVKLCAPCPRRQDPDFLPMAISLWAFEVYHLLDVGRTGLLPAAAVTMFQPREHEALQIVQLEVCRQIKREQPRGKT